MSRVLFLIYIFRLLLVAFGVISLSSCMETPRANRYQSDDDSSDNTDPNDLPTDNSTDDKIYWFTASQKYLSEVSVTSSSSLPIYLRGKNVSTFLNNDDNFYKDSSASEAKTYCLSANFSGSNSSVKKQIRFRAIPETITTTIEGKSVKLRQLKIDLANTTSNSNACNGPIYSSGYCSIDNIYTSSLCTLNGGTWTTGICSDLFTNNSTACLARGYSWNIGLDVGTCSNNNSITYSSCISASASNTWNIGICSLDRFNNTTKALCTANGGTWHQAVSAISNSNTAFSINTICTNCTGDYNFQNIALYPSKLTGIDGNAMIASAVLEPSALNLKIKISSDDSGNNGNTSCTDSSCKQLGSNYCCFEGTTCKAHKSTRPNASQDPSYNQALSEIAEDPTNILRWENLFFICPGMSLTDEDDPYNDNPDSDDLLKQQILFYKCFEGAAQETPDYSACCFNGATNCSTSTYQCLLGKNQTTSDLTKCCSANDSTCSTIDYNNVLGSSALQYQRYLEARNEVWKTYCGCAQDFTAAYPNDAATLCADFELIPKYNPNDATEIVGMSCKKNSESSSPTTTTTISGKNTPHRFFDSTGINYDDLTKITNSSTVQEGEEFNYLDENNLEDPENGSYNINSLLGSMLITLNKTLPAKKVTVVSGTTYIITAAKGSFTPCPTCDTDSWDSTTSAHPTSSNGLGLKPSSYANSRRENGTNETSGNYEDTHFGRACWIPPTMIPYSHQKNSSLIDQRKNRLATQSAYYMNGYQRDWFGFNKGALIGSFDGVSWFAIGSARRVVATSNKLFLAINSSFSDISSSNVTYVEVSEDLGGNLGVADYDYDPSKALDKNNQGASCQKFHQCSTDSDCISQLGWEYMCLDVSNQKSYFPKFDIDANELANTEISSAFNVNDRLIKSYPEGSLKRCVYRGAGAICKNSYTTNLSTGNQKQFTCAPNFYCAQMSSSSFNAEIARTPNYIDIFDFGYEKNVLGRPLNYVNATKSLTTPIISNIGHNASIFSTNYTDFGLCRPGKALVDTYVSQHKSKDSSRRTDYISQVASCDATKVGNNRVWSCPIIDTDDSETNSNFGNYIFSTTNYNLFHNQNSCGRESTNSSATSAFASIEALSIPNITSLTEETLVRDACLRRAGSVCHTDLECGPNSLHASIASSIDLSFFGNTEAERSYWSENLICGQAQDPIEALSNKSSFDLTLNKCCREVGKELTMYTAGSLSVIPDLGSDNTLLNTSLLPHTNTSINGRYSRFEIVAPITSTVNADGTAHHEIPRVTANTTPKKFQWKTINDTGKKSCCGGGWIREFASGERDWSDPKRLNFNYENFKCLNYQNSLLFAENLNTLRVNQNNFYKYESTLCYIPENGACLQIPFPESSATTITPPYKIPSTGYTGTLDTSLVKESDGTFTQDTDINAHYLPTPYTLNPTQSLMRGDRDRDDNYFMDSLYYGVSFYLPTYIGGSTNIISVSIKYQNSSYATLGTMTATRVTCPSPGTSASGWLNPRDSLGTNEWCIAKDALNRYDVFHIKADPNAYGSGWTTAGVVINFNVMGTPNYAYQDSSGNSIYSATSTSAPGLGLKAGNAAYYLTKLGRLELIGIPQIFYEPIYCNSDMNQLVPGIFNLSNDTRSTFESSTNSFSYTPSTNGGKSLGQIYDSTNTAITSGTDITNPNEKITYQNKLAIEPIFSGHKFSCCLELGNSTYNAEKCCSNYATVDPDDSKKYICQLPDRANLSVYFNKFISSEGMSKSLDNPLTDDDFVPETGEPKLRTATSQKLVALGQKFCASGKVRSGSSIARYWPEPGDFALNSDTDTDQRFLSIIDSIYDNNQNGIPSTYTSEDEDSSAYFKAGFRWSHHIYCDDTTTTSN